MFELIKKFLKLFESSSYKILDLINKMENKSQSQEVINKVTEIINLLIEKSTKLLPDIVKRSYKEGSRYAINEMIRQGIKESELNSSLKVLVHERAVQEIVNEAFYSILEATDNMAQDVKQRIKEIVKEANLLSLNEGLSRKKAVESAISIANSEQITGIIDKAGKRWPIDKYMANVIQYHQRKAHVEGVLNRMKENNQDLVYINYVGITCDYCAKYQGRVYSLSGNDTRFPYLEKRPPYHSHCVHSATPWVEEYKEENEIEEMIKSSNRPFTDNRTEKDIEKYEELQRKKSKQNDTRKQWIRYKARLPNDTPDLKTFASIKARKTNSYQQLQEDYRKIGQEIKERGKNSK